MEAKVKHSKDGSFKIPDELAEASLLNPDGLSFVDIRMSPHHLIQEYSVLRHLKHEAQKQQNRKANLDSKRRNRP